MKLTPWFPGYIKPARVGVYRRQFNHSESSADPLVRFALWDGRQWVCFAMSPEKAMSRRSQSLYQLNMQWCGLAEEPA